MRVLPIRLTEFDEENLKTIREFRPLLLSDTAVIRAALERYARQACESANVTARRRNQRTKAEATK